MHLMNNIRIETCVWQDSSIIVHDFEGFDEIQKRTVVSNLNFLFKICTSADSKYFRFLKEVHDDKIIWIEF